MENPIVLAMFYEKYIFFVATLLCIVCIIVIFHNSIIKGVLAIPSDQTDVIFFTWKILPPTSDIKSISIDFSGNIYFAEKNGNKIGRLVPSSKTVTEWVIPTNSSGPVGVDFDSLSGNIYFIESNGNKIGRLVPSANTYRDTI